MLLKGERSILFAMSTVQDIETAIRRLSHDDLSALRVWLAAYDAEGWDQEIAADAQNGQLDALCQEMQRENEGQPMIPLKDFLDQQAVDA